MADVLITITPEDGGNVDIENGRTALTDGLETCINLMLYGGNLADAGTDATKSLQWWGNFAEADATKHLRSRTQALVDSLPLTPSNLLRIEDAARADTSDLLALKIASSVLVSASLPSVNAVAVDIKVVSVDGSEFSRQYILKKELSRT